MNNQLEIEIVRDWTIKQKLLIDLPDDFNPHRRGPKNTIPLSNPKWPNEVAERYDIPLDLSRGTVHWEKNLKRISGRCFSYPNRKWAIGLSYPRLIAEGRYEMEQTLAHELIHAWIVELSGANCHGPVFDGMARMRNIERYCSQWETVEAGLSAQGTFDI